MKINVTYHINTTKGEKVFSIEVEKHLTKFNTFHDKKYFNRLGGRNSLTLQRAFMKNTQLTYSDSMVRD